MQSRILEWKNHIYGWLTNFTGPKHIVFYEHLQNQLLEELVRLSVFLELKSKPSDIWCTVQNQEGRFHRKKPEWFVASSLFNDTMKATVQSEIDKLYKLMTTNAVPSEVRNNFDLLYRKT